jgi:hypothetical protein
MFSSIVTMPYSIERIHNPHPCDNIDRHAETCRAGHPPENLQGALGHAFHG